MPSDQITLSSSIRQNLLSLQNTTRLLDLTSNRLSTGLKVNSSLDNPASFFAARSLTNRASDLNSRKDGIGQGISLLQSTDKSITAITSLVEQAKAKVTEADEAATAGISTISTEKAATIAGTSRISTDFDGTVTAATQTLATVGGTATDVLTATINGTATTFEISANNTVADLVTALNGLNSVTAVFNTTSGEIDITATGGSELNLNDTTGASFFGVGELGGFKLEGVTTLAANTTQTFSSTNTATDVIDEVFGVADGDQLTIAVTNGGSNTFTVETGAGGVATTVQDLLDGINAADTALTATYNTTTSKVDIKAPEGTAVTFTDANGTPVGNLTLNDGTNNVVSASSVTYSKLGTATEVGGLTTDFQTLLDQINGLITDASYKGTNLLKAATTLDVKFNATGDSKLTIEGKALEADSNGILAGLKFTQKNTDYDFTTAGDITSALADVDAAITELRTISSTFSTSLGIMQTREDFTNELVNALDSGAAKLVNANLEEESAKLLALQTRQAIGVQSLAIANTSQQSILALFR
jgi:flagellin-like hook-associated protein FlgL